MTATPGDREVASAAPSTAASGRIPADTFASRLVLARHHAGHVSIREAADMTGLNREAWRDWERGRRPRDILDVVRRIATALDIDHDWLLFGGPLTGPRGVPTKRAAGLNDGYGAVARRPRDTRPNGRPTPGRHTHPPAGGLQRRAVRIGNPVAVAVTQ